MSTSLGRLRWVSARVAVVSLMTALLAVALTATHPAPASAAALRGCSSDGPYEVCFTDPFGQPGDEDRTIIDRLITLIDGTQKDDIVRIAMYTWTLDGIAKRVAAAHDRGVDIRVVLDDNGAVDRAYDILKSRGVPVHVCTNSCMGTKINHNKFFLFDYGDKVSVVQTSMNLTGAMLGRQNNLVKVWNDAKLYDFYRDYWNRLNHESWTYDGVTWSNADRHQTGSYATKGYVFPRTDFDPVLAILNNVTSCSGSGHIWLAESLFTDAREAVRNRLAYLEDKMGCDVKVIVHKEAQEKWVQSTTSGGYNLGNGKVRRAAIHHKFILIDAKYNGEQTRYVFTGSHNLTGNSLHNNDEAMMRIRNAFVYEQFEKHFTGLFAEAAG